MNSPVHDAPGRRNVGLKVWGAIGATAATLLLLLWMAGFLTSGKIHPGTVPQSPTGPDSGPTVQVRVDEQPLMREAVGTVGSRVAVAVASQVMANVLDVTVGVGATVHKGDVLLRLDGRDLTARLREAEAGASTARAALGGAEADYKRFEALIARHAVTQKEFEDVRTGYAMAQSRLQAAEQAVAQARVALGYVEISAPIDGVVAEKMVEPGDLAVPGKPLLMLHDPQQLRIEAAVAEELAPRVALGAPVSVHVDALGKAFSTRIDEIIPRADPLTRTIAVRASLPAGEGLQPGMFGRLSFPAGSVRTLSIPRRAVRRIGQLESVQVMTPSGPRSRHVQTGVLRDDQVEILAGLEAGESVLLPADAPHD
ncbi:MAG TPA: efflux RND transporter periplasmic adaptor subunit [Candidatus Acidoferrales bacterium]|nr:efflux RND transporter periplasmic adaptor subunit [Candidatus Acidoferrales bacterium]